MSAAAAGESTGTGRLLRIAYWTLPPLLAVWFYWLGIKSWFLADDFAWLIHATEFSNFRELIHAIFVPMAQGTIRPWSERVFFMVFYHVFGLNPLPFHIWIFLTQCANILLLLSVARHLTASRIAGFAAALFWIFNTSWPLVMTWTSVYNEALCAFFLLLAFRFLLRYLETGERRYWLLQWAAFILGFGALELNVVYPALAAAYTLLCARKYFLRTLPLFAASIVFAVVHRMAAPTASGVYQMHFGLAMLDTLYNYWSWALGPAFLASMVPMAAWMVTCATLLFTAVVLGATAWSVWKGDHLPLFCLAWFVILIAPVLPLSEHRSEYYHFLPTIGLAMWAGWALARAWRQTLPWKVAAAVLALIYFGSSAEAVRRSTRWEYERTRNVRKLVLGVQRAQELHPGKVILLDGVDDQLFWTGFPDRPFTLLGANYVYLTPGTEKQIEVHPGFGEVADFLIPPGPTWRALMRDEAVVYSVRGERLRNVTNIYTDTAPAAWQSMIPARIDLSNPAEGYLLGPEWHQIEGNHRWMPQRATLHLAGPQKPGAKLHLVGAAGTAATRLTVAVDGEKLPERLLTPGDAFDFEWPIPPAAVARPQVEIGIETDKTFTLAIDGRPLGLVFGIVEIR
jgi:hypothetical protein